MYLIINRLKIVGNERQVKEIRAFLKGNSDEDGNEVYIDFNKIVKMPKGLIGDYTQLASAMQLLLGSIKENTYTIEEAREKYKEHI